MSFTPDLLVGFLPFWIVNYGLALVAWSCLARFTMQAFMAPDSPNYIWRAFRFLSSPGVALARLLTPRYVVALWWPLLGAVWVFGLRFVASLLMLMAGWAPRLSTMQGG
jgi:hypothetical protein